VGSSKEEDISVFCGKRDAMKMRCLRRGQWRSTTKGQAGMTLIEVVVALFVTSLAIGGIVQGYRYATNSAYKAAIFQAATARAMERIEEARSANWSLAAPNQVDLIVATNFPPEPVTLDLSGSGALATRAMLRTEIFQISTNPPLKRIRVSCIWTNLGNQIITNSIETLRAPDQ
jgi:prepilin-type N-terminal cleavage/methylation domain-containing protein